MANSKTDPQSIYVTLGGRYCQLPSVDYLPACWKANSYVQTLGIEGGHGWLLLLKSDFDDLLPGRQVLTFGTVNNKRETVNIPGVVIMRGINVTHGLPSDDNCVLLCEVCDPGHLAWRHSYINQLFNVRCWNGIGNGNDADFYYYDTLNAGAPWTWDALCGQLFDQCGCGLWPGLNWSPTGYPQSWSFPGVSAWEALHTILNIKFTGLARNWAGGYRTCRLGQQQVGLDDLEKQWKNRLLDGSEYRPYYSRLIPTEIPIVATLYNNATGLESEGGTDNSTLTNSQAESFAGNQGVQFGAILISKNDDNTGTGQYEYLALGPPTTVDLVGFPKDEAVSVGLARNCVWIIDDFDYQPSEVGFFSGAGFDNFAQFGSPLPGINASQAARTQEIIQNYVYAFSSGQNLNTYAGFLPDFACGEQIKAVMFSDSAGGKTSVFKYPGQIKRLLDKQGVPQMPRELDYAPWWDRKGTGERLAPNKMGRPAVRISPRLDQMISVGLPVAGNAGYFDGTIATFFNVFVYDVAEAPAPTGEHIGRFYGQITLTVDGSDVTRPLFLISDNHDIQCREIVTSIYTDGQTGPDFTFVTSASGDGISTSTVNLDFAGTQLAFADNDQCAAEA